MVAAGVSVESKTLEPVPFSSRSVTVTVIAWVTGRRDAVADADGQVVDVVGAGVGRGLEVGCREELQHAGLRRRW